VTTIHDSVQNTDMRVTACDLPCQPHGFALVAEKPHKFAQHLLSQQIWCWGQDIESIHGNLLVRYGFQRVPPPADTKVPSCYHMESDGATIILRGFGVFYENDRLGGLYLARYGFAPQLAEGGRVNRPIFTTEDLPPLHKSQIGEEDRCRLLLTSLIDWICRYEVWVVDEFGIEYRCESLRPWSNPKRVVIPATEIVATWQWLSRAVRKDDGRTQIGLL